MHVLPAPTPLEGPRDLRIAVAGLVVASQTRPFFYQCSGHATTATTARRTARVVPNDYNLPRSPDIRSSEHTVPALRNDQSRRQSVAHQALATFPPRIVGSTTDMSNNVKTLPPPEAESQRASRDTTPLLEKSPSGATRYAKRTIGFQCVFSQSHVFCLICQYFIGPDLFTIVSRVLESTGTGRTLLALFALALLALVISRGLVQMLRLWPIQSNTIIFAQNYVDPWLGIVIGWLPCLMYSCWYVGLTVQRTTLIDALGLGRTSDIFTNAITFAVPVLFALIPNEWLKHLQGWLVAVKLLIASTILIIMFYVNESIAYSQSRLVSREDATFSGDLVHKYITGTMYAAFMLSRIYFGVETLSSVAPEMTVESPGLHESDEGSVSTMSHCLNKY